MKTEFNLTNKKKRNAKISIISKVLFLFVMIPYTIVIYKEISTFLMVFFLLSILLFSSISIAQDNFRIKHEKLLLFPTGIEYKTFTYEVFSRWNELKMIETDPSLLNNFEWVITNSKRVKNKSLLLRLLLSERTNSIPVYTFAENWRDSELGQQIKQYAPHLFELEAQNHANQT